MTDEVPMQDNRIHYLYRITNKINGKIYIGQTVQPDKRWTQHKTSAASDSPKMIISYAIKKYGNDAFDFEVIAGCKSWEDANNTETLLVQQYNCQVPHGYNVAPGGINAPKSEAWKQIMREHWADPAYKARVSAAISQTHMGMGHTEATRQKLSIVNHAAGNPNFGKPRTEDTKKKIANTLIGISHTDERRKKQSLAKIKTTPEQEQEIRTKFSAGMNLARLAREFGFSKTLIRRVVNG